MKNNEARKHMLKEAKRKEKEIKHRFKYACFIIFAFALIQHASAATITVDGGTESAIQDAINAASAGDIIYLTGDFAIDDIIDIDKSLTFTGDAEVKLIDDLGWNSGKTMFYASGVDDITFTGDLTFDGNSQGNTDVPFGQGYYGLFLFRNCDYVTFDGVTMEYGKTDFIVYRNGNHITVTNCTLNKSGHEALYSLYSNYVEFTNNDCFTRTNAAVRIASGQHVLISNNEIYSGTITSADGGGSSTGPGIEINIDAGQPASDIEISKNYIHDLRGSGIWMTSESTRGDDVYIHNNIIRDVGNYPSDNRYSTAGITIWQFNGTLIENNVFDDTGIAGVRYAKRATDGTVDEEFSTIVRNNVFINIRDHITISAEAVMNTNPSAHTFYVYNNDFFNNYDVFDGDLCIGWSNFYLNPMFSDSMYHLKSDSPLIGAGYNGADLGAYGIGSEVIGQLPIIKDEPEGSDEPSTDPTDDANTDTDNSTYEYEEPEQPSQDTDNSTYPYEPEDPNTDTDNSTVETPEDEDDGFLDPIDESDDDGYVDNSTTEYVDNSTSHHNPKGTKDRHDGGTGKARVIDLEPATNTTIVAAPVVEPDYIPSAEYTKPTYRK